MTNKSPIKLCITLIHNKDRKRYTLIKSSLRKMSDEISSKFNIEFFEISEQPPIIEQNIVSTLFRKYLYWKINREWIHYRELTPRNIIFDLLVFLRRLIITYMNRDSESKRSITEAIVTDKHIRAWVNFLESSGDFLICFEDDTVFRKDSVVILKKLLQEIHKFKDKVIYLDFAGGLNPEIIKVDNLEFKSDKLRKYYKKPVTNTACCYMINRLSAEIFFINLLIYPWIRLIGIDWVLNKLFIITSPKYKYYCYHASVFDHGSSIGRYISWM